jgi:hypothetical protein
MSGGAAVLQALKPSTWHVLGAYMKWNRWTRQTHRWLAILFTLAVIVNIVLNLLPTDNDSLATRVGILTLVPLALLLLTGLYLFVLPYLSRNDTRSRIDT